ncbi:hypothetical protein E3P86_01722 [Wallemia ichthyophaga]|uniref:KN homeodomain domain-containing protein n=1 Tax=Wallemia ichthyophaga TaxID=245174 RepID=A0A4T0JDE5_WALIC|nr:hypothetical protein E3P86_01722 [Wallemia ichthyophaga]
MNKETLIANAISSKIHKFNISWIVYTCYIEDLFFRGVLNQRLLLRNFVETFRKFSAEYDSEYKSGQLSPFVVNIVQNLMFRINKTSKVIQLESLTNYSGREPVAASVSTSNPLNETQYTTRNIKFEACHQYFTDNIAYPYPSDKSEREYLAAKDGASLKQVDQWFTNHRKRSGWNHICNIAESKETASKLVKLVLSGPDQTMLPNSVTSIVATYIQRGTNNPRNIPSEGLKNAIDQLSNRYPFLSKKRKRDEGSSNYLSTFFQ